MFEEHLILFTPRPSQAPCTLPLYSVGRGAALTASHLGFAAFTERNHPRYIRYVSARLATGVEVIGAVNATLAYAREDWDWLLAQPSLAAEVWGELRYQVRRLSSTSGSARDAAVHALYGGLSEISADSRLLCHHLGLPAGEAAELMGVDVPAVQAGLAVASRHLPHLTPRRCI